MKVNILITDNFKKEAKKLLKKYRSLKGELRKLNESLEENPKQGTVITEDTYKIRLAVKSKGKGKSGGLRIITYLYIKYEKESDLTEVYLLSIYDKSDYSNISKKILKQLISDAQKELDEQSESDYSGEEE